MNTMLKYFNYIVLLLFINIYSYSQTPVQGLLLASELKQNGNFQEAIKLYKRILFFDEEDSLKNLCYHNIGDCLAYLEVYQQAYDYFDLSLKFENDDSTKYTIYKKKIICLLMIEKWDEAQIQMKAFYDLPSAKSDLTQLNLLYHLKMKNYDILFNELKQIDNIHDKEKVIQLIKKLKKYDPKKAKKLSTFLPGLGQLYLGFPAKGLNSLVLVSGIGIFTVNQMLHSVIPIDVALTGLPFIIRYYKGGIQKTQQIAIKKNREIEKEVINEFLKIKNP